jgi:hypothetical protein
LTNEMIFATMAIITAYIAYIKKFDLIPNKYLPVVAIGMAAIFVIVPLWLYNILFLISMIGLGATGYYHMNKGDKKT